MNFFLKTCLLVTSAISITACSGTSSIADGSSTNQGQAGSPPEPTDPTAFSAMFPKGSIWSTDISNAPLDPESAATINWMKNNGNWGGGKLGWWPHDWLRIAMEWRLIRATASTPMVPFVKRADYYSPACDNITQFPIPVGGGIQSSEGYEACNKNTGGDCHLVVYDPVKKKLWESYMTDYENGKITSTCGVVWDTSKVYPIDGRGDNCTSTDAAGAPSGALLFTADDLAAGHIDHALRLTLPNSMLRSGRIFVHPATHASTAPSAPSPAPIYGARFRLKASFDISRYSAGMQVILTAMKKYGMVVSDGGDIAISAANDRDTKHKYSEFGLDEYRSLSTLTVDNFEVVDGGARIPLTFGCVRNGY